MDLSDPKRDAIHATIQENPPDFESASVLVGWALVCEWMDESGEKWLSREWSSSVPRWTANGMWHEALNGVWDVEEDE